MAEGTRLRLAFLGTPDFAVPSLTALLEAGHDVAAVYTQPPRAAGRGLSARRSAVHEVADGEGLNVLTPGSLKDRAEQEAFQALGLDAAVVVAYGLILPKPILRAPRLGCINVHASLLPRWRGAAPIQRAIMAGDKETGVSIMQMDEGLDTGPVFLEGRVPIGPGTTAGALHDELAALGASLLVETLAALSRDAIKAEPQPEEGVTYARKIEKAETQIDWTRPAADLDCHIRGLSPYPGAWFEAVLGGRRQRVRVLLAEPVEGQGLPGTVLDDRLTVACGKGALRLVELQRAGKSAMDGETFLRGTPVQEGAVL